MDPVKIPFGYKRVYGQTRKGDGVWLLPIGRFVKVGRILTRVPGSKRNQRVYPNAADFPEKVFIRRCTVEQIDLLQTENPA